MSCGCGFWVDLESFLEKCAHIYIVTRYEHSCLYFFGKLDYLKIYVPCPNIRSNWKILSHIENERHTHIFCIHTHADITQKILKKILCFVKSVFTGQTSNMEHRSVFFLVLDNIIWAFNLVTMSVSTLQKLGQTWNLFKLVSLIIYIFLSFLVYHFIVSWVQILQILICKHIVKHGNGNHVIRYNS